MTVNEARRMKAVARWHRRVAVLVMAWLAFLALTGFFINHAHDWALDRAPLASSLQSLVYGIEPDSDDVCVDFPQAGEECARVFTSVQTPFGHLLVADSALLLLDGEGSLVERLPAAMTGLATIDAARVDADTIYLRGGGQVVRTSTDLVEFLPVGGEPGVAAESAWESRGESPTGVTWERFLLDLHAARFLGPFGPWFTDLMAALILLLAASGLWLHRLKRNANGSGR